MSKKIYRITIITEEMKATGALDAIRAFIAANWKFLTRIVVAVAAMFHW
jgi:hypothetical protein